MDTTARRGAVVYSIALCTYHRFFHLFLPLLNRALDLYFESPANEVALLERVCKSIDQLPLGALPVSVQTPLETRACLNVHN